MSKLTGYFKKIIIGSMLTLTFFGGMNVFADGTTVPSTTSCNTAGERSSKKECKDAREAKLAERASFLDSILKAMYLLIRPIIMIAGLAIDNKLVFGESIGLDLYLRKFWTIMMVIAYMGLAVSLLMTVYDGLKEGGDKLISKLKETGKKTILAAILIPMSWFLVQQLVNLSTLLTFSVGALPLYVSATSEPDCSSPKSKDDALCTSLLQTHTRFNLTDVFGGDWKSLALYSTRDPSKDEVSAIYLQCPISSSKINPEQYDKMVKGLTTGGEDYKALREIATNMIMEKGKPLTSERVSAAVGAGKGYCVIKSNTLLAIGNEEIPLFGDKYNKGIVDAADVLRGQANTKIHSILELNKSAIGPLYAIYGSILDFGSIGTNNTTNASIGTNLIEMILKMFQGFMLFIPLVGFAIVMVVRMGYLWVIIGFSPLIVLVNTVFKDGDAAKKVKDIKYFGSLGETLNRVQIAKLIMQPTIVMFALSIGLIFLAIIQNTLSLNKDAMDFYSFGVQMETNTVNQSCFDIMSLQTVCLDGAGLGYGLGILSDLFNRGILNIIGIMVVRGLFFMALKSNKITEAVAKNVETIAENYVGSREIIPVGDGKAVGFKAAGQGITDTIDAITKVTESKQYENIIKPEVERRADIVDGKRGEMNAGIEKSLNEKETTNGVETTRSQSNDTKAIDTAIDAIGSNTNFSISDVDSKSFKGDDIWGALTDTKNGFYSASKDNKSYNNIIQILDKKKVGVSNTDKETYMSKMKKSVEGISEKYPIGVGKDFIALTKDRSGVDAFIKVTYEEGKSEIKDITGMGDELISGFKKSKNIDEMTAYLKDTFNGNTGSIKKSEAIKLMNRVSSQNIGADGAFELELEGQPDKNNPDAARTKATYIIKINDKGQATISPKPQPQP